ncbi:MAG: hypothetical protein IT447_12205 [Phycisphaerales bacterium]|nr:hypothetical protein [Phycisphaerales bacterium]
MTEMTWNSPFWHWLVETDGGLMARIGVGAAILGVLAGVEIRNKGLRQSKRWREYLFLLTIVAAALVYGVINDLLTSRISWEYFYYGKGVAEVLGPPVPPLAGALAWEAAKVGMRATWTAGLIIGVVLLVANNPSRRWPSLSYGRLIAMAGLVFVITAITAAILGWVGSTGWFTHWSGDFAEMVRNNEMRPMRFMTVFGIHLGGYVGALIGMVMAVVLILRRRFQRVGNVLSG